MRLDPRALAALALLTAAAPAVAQGSPLAELRRMVPYLPLSQGIATGDVDGDGDVDALVAVPDRVVYLRNSGGGRFEAAPGGVGAVFGVPRYPALADIDGDGDPDLLTREDALCRWYTNDGAGVFVPHPAPPLAWPALHPALEDFDADGDVDVFFGGANGGTVYANSGTGAFAEAPGSLPGVHTNAHQIVAGDLDGDGDLDAVAARYNLGALLYLNGGAGVFALGAEPIPAGLPVQQIGLGDFDGDGDLDIAAAISQLGAGGMLDRIYTNDGTGVFTEVPGSIQASSSSTLLVGDLDADGDPDLLNGVHFEWFAANRVLLNDGTGILTELVGAAPPLYTGTKSSALDTLVALDDVDGDADLDILMAVTNELYLNDGQARFVDVSSGFLGRTWTSQAGVAAGDVNGDGRIDAVHASHSRVDLLLNDGTSGLVGAHGLVPAPGAIPGIVRGWRVALGDLDGDGDADLVIGRVSSSYLALDLLANDGNGVFAQASANLPVLSAPDGLHTRDIELGDVDADGDLDVVVAASLPSNFLLLNDGSGVFADASAQVSSVTGPAFAVELGDVDGDGGLDAVWGRYNQQNQLSLGVGGGTFVDATAQLPADTDDTESLALADVDGDGDLDLAATTTGAAVTRLALNDGAGFFTDVTATHLPTGIDVGQHVVFGDYDGDGDLDLYGAKRMLLNTGAGAFVETSHPLPADQPATSGAVAADFDGDDDLDVLVAGRALLLTNVTSGVAAQATPGVGKPLPVQVFGPPSSLYVLGVSAGNVAIPLPPYGTLGIDLASAQFVGGVTSASGADELVLPIAANPNLVDVTLYWQALVGGPRFTNVEATTFTNL